MQAVRIDPTDLDALSPAWDAAVDRHQPVDAFCSSSTWSFAAARSFPEVGEPEVVAEGRAFVGFRSATTEDGSRLFLGLDPIWGFATPVVGHPSIAAALTRALLDASSFDAAVITGQREDRLETQQLIATLGDRYQLLRGGDEARLRADIAAGHAAWFARRSSRFRQRLRRLERDAEGAGFVIDDVSALAPELLLERILHIEAASWKGGEGSGLTSPDLADFYRRMVWRLAGGDGIRALIARRDDLDTAYILGGVRGRTYRGFQLSQRADVREYGLGHLLQWHQIRRLDGTGIDVYDLGMEMDYKHRWSDETVTTFALVVRP